MTRKMQIPSEYREEAEKLASLPYKVVLKPDETTDGNPIILAINPELPGCMSHGADSLEAVENLKQARTDYINSLLARKLTVPMPTKIAGETGQSFSTEPVMVIFNSLPSSVSTKDVQDRVDHVEGQELLVESWVIPSV